MSEWPPEYADPEPPAWEDAVRRAELEQEALGRELRAEGYVDPPGWVPTPAWEPSPAQEPESEQLTLEIDVETVKTPPWR